MTRNGGAYMKKLTSFFLVLVLSICCLGTYNINVQAEEIGEDVDLSFLMTDSALIGYSESQTWGAYLLEGFSVINDAGGGKIGAGGSTTAVTKCTVSVNAVVERKVDGSWVRVTSWTVTNTNAYSAVAGKTISVGSGYYYRVRCVHRASTDASSSCTGALWM